MRDQDRRGAVGLDLGAQQLQYAVRGIGIEVAGRFVGQHQFRPVRQRSRNRHALHLAAGQLARIVVGALFQADRRQHLGGARQGLVVQQQGQGDVLLQRQVRQHVERLEHEADALAPQARGGIVVQRRHGLAVDQDFAAVGAVQTRNKIEQGRFADAGISHDGDIFAGAQGEIEAVEDDALAAVRLAKGAALERQGRRRAIGGRVFLHAAHRL